MAFSFRDIDLSDPYSNGGDAPMERRQSGGPPQNAPVRTMPKSSGRGSIMGRGARKPAWKWTGRNGE